MEKESFEQYQSYRSAEREKNPDDDTKEKLEAQGWQRASGLEYTHSVSLDKNIRFTPKEIKTRQEIIKDYLDRYKKHGFTEIRLVNAHRWRDGLGWQEDPHAFYVFLRRPEDSERTGSAEDQKG